MKFTDLFIRRPIMAIALSLLILIVGIQAIFKLQVREYPELSNTIITVSTAYYGASSEVIQGFITQPLQQAIAEAENVDYIESSSAAGLSTITVQMVMNADSDSALSEVMSKVNSVRAVLPSEALDPNVSRSSGASASIMYISFSSDVMSPAQTTDYVKRNVQNRLLTVDGVSKVSVYGPDLAMRVWLDPLKLANYNLSAAEVSAALSQNNFRAAPGQAKSRYFVYNVEADTDLKSVEDFRQLIIARSEQGLVRLGDVAEVQMDAGREIIHAKANAHNAVIIAIDAGPTANPLTVAAGVHQRLPSVDQALPAGLEMELLYDATVYIQSSINEVLLTIVEATAIVVLTIFLFMGSLRAVIVPVIAIPLSLVGVCLVMQVMGFSINLLTLLAMVLAIGLVVDDAIVVVENIDRHIGKGASVFDAAIKGTREIAAPVISMTITLIAVYSPIALLGGLTGSLMKEFALTLAGAVFVSGFVALTLSPVMCAKLFKPKTQAHGFEAFVHRSLDGLDRAYARGLDRTLARRPAILLFAFMVLASLYPLFNTIEAELAPAEDKGAIFVIANAPAGANLDYIDQYMSELARRGSKEHDVAGTIMFSGFPTSTNGFGVMQTKVWDEREDDLETLTQKLTLMGADIAGVSTVVFPFPSLPGGGSGLPVQFVLKANDDYQSMLKVAQQLSASATASGLFIFSDLDLKYDSAKMRISVDRDKAGAYGVKMQDIASTLSILMGDGYINHISIDGRSYEVIPQVKRIDRLSPEAIGDFYVKSQSGQPIPLANLITWELKGEPASLKQMDQANAVSFSAVLMPGGSMGEALAFLEAEAARVLPKGYEFDYKSESRQYTQEGNALYLTFVLALLVIFLVLAAQFESWRDPLVIMTTVPLAICGALLMMGWGLASINIYTQIGLITLVGLITKHGILMCEVAKVEQMQNGSTRLEAIRHAARVRLRAVLMTTISMVAGLIPLLLAVGPGAAARFDIGLVICAGLGIGTIFTLFILPTVYSYLGSKHEPLPSVEHL